MDTAVASRPGAAEAPPPLPGASPAAAARLPRLRLPVLLLGLVLAVLLPALGFGGVAAWQAVRGQQAAAEGRLRDTAQSLALAVDGEIGAYKGAMAALAGSISLDGPAPDLERFEIIARRTAAALGTPVALMDGASMRQILNTALPPGRLPGAAPTVSLRSVAETGRPLVTNLVTSTATGDPVVGVAVPVERDGRVAFVLSARLSPERLHRLLAAAGLPAGTRATVVDAGNVIVARSDATHAAVVGQPISAESARAIAGQEEGFYRTVAIDGVERVFGLRRLALAPGWTVVVAQPAAAFDAAWRGPARALAAGAALALALGGGLAALVMRGLLAPLRRLGRHARVLAEGEAGAPGASAAAIPPARIAELEALRRGFAEAEAAITAREARLSALFRASPVGVVHADAGGRVYEANDAFLAIVGMTRADLAAGRVRWDELTPPDCLAADEAAIAEAMAAPDGRCRPYEKAYLRPDGTRVPVLVSFALLDRAAGLAACFVVDLTEVRRGEAALARQAGLRAMLLEVSHAVLEEGRDEAALTTFVFDRVARRLGADLVLSHVLDEAEGLLRLAAGPGVPPEGLDAVRTLRLGISYCGTVAATRTPVVADAARIARDAEAEPLRGMGVQAYVCCPLLGSDGRLLGTLCFGSTRRDDFDRVEAEFFQSLSHLVALAWQRRQAEAALRQSEAASRRSQAMFEGLFEHSPDAILVVDREGRIRQANMQMQEIFGYRREELLGQAIEMLLPERNRAAHARHRTGYVEAPDPRPMGAGLDLWGRRRDGTEVPLDILISPLPGSGEGAALAVIRDVTQRRRVEASLAESEARLRDLLATLDLGPSMTRDPDGTIRFWSEGCARLYGWTAAEVTGRDMHALLHTRFPMPRAEVEAALARDGEWTGDLRQQTRGGAEIVVTARKTLRRGPDGRPLAVLESFADVTAQRRAKAALAEREAQLRLAQRIGGSGSFDWNVASNRATYSEEYVALHGLPPGTTTESFESWLARVHPEDRERAVAAMRAVLEPDPPLAVEYRIIRPSDGAVRWIAERREVFRDAEGRPLRVVGSQRDVTGQREAEAVLARDKEELERLVSERTRDLHETQARLAHAQRMEALGQLAGGIAHDFNNVLQAVGGGAALIERRPGDPEGVRRLARMVRDAAGRGAAITRRLLAFARRGELRAEAVDPAAALAGMREILSHTLGAEVAVRVETPAGLPALLADKGQLDTVLVNLASNARDAMPEGGVLTLSAAAEVLERDSGPGHPVPLKAGRYVRLVVADTGAGMPPEVLARAAEPFFTTKAQGKGTGLGLAMARGFAEQSGGGLHIESAPGRGTTVTLWFPLAEGAGAAADTVAAGARPEADRHRHASILLVDDDAAVRQVTAEGLEAAGYRVVTAESGPEALAALDAGEAVDLVVTDLSMPGMSGLSVIREAQRRRPGLPAILLTGYAGNAATLAMGGAVSGTFSLLRKPVTAEQLAERVAVLLEGAEIAGGGRGRLT